MNENKTIVTRPDIVKFENVINKSLFFTSVSLAGTNAATSGNYSIFFTALRPLEVVEISEVHGTAGTNGSPVTLQIERLQGTEAKGSGDDILNTAFDMKSTANTVVIKKFGEISNTILSIGDRLALEISGTLTSLADVSVTVLLKPLGRGHFA